MSEISIRIGDNIDILKEYPNNHFDSIVTNAPYGLGKEPDAAKLIQDWIDHGYHAIKGSGFMGKEWDAFVPQPIFWKECLRVLKPGGYLLCFFGTRTYDWGTLAIRLAGFEIRDMITWHYGSGFPKSMAIDKAIDKAEGIEREVTGSIKTNTKMQGGNFNGEREDKKGGIVETTRATGENAIKFDGWGTALKPATEPICVARKPIVGTVADNMIKYGTGGINIDACRVGLDGIEVHTTEGKSGLGNNVFGKYENQVKELTDLPRYDDKGRFPANVIFDPFTASILDEQTGVLTSGQPCGVRKATNNIYGHYAPGQDVTGFGDSGGASRFFYVAKASSGERNAGCENLTNKKDFGHSRFDKCGNCGGYVLQGENRDSKCVCDNSVRENLSISGNFHPTVKPIALLQYLQRLVTPVGGLTLDPFAGSGTSGCSAALEEFNIVLIEREEEYNPIIEARTTYWKKEARRLKNHKLLVESQQTLF